MSVEDQIATNLGKVFMMAAEASVHKEWSKSHHDYQGEFTYFFQRNYSGCATVVLSDDGTIVFEGRNHSITIKNIGTSREKIVLKNAADIEI